MEIWRDIKGYEGYYQASNLGRLRGVNRTIRYKDGHYQSKKEKIMSPAITKWGYKMFFLHKNGVGKSFKLSRLIALTFIPNPENKPEVNHMDGNKLNDVVDNLEWVTASENQKHAYRLGLKCTKGEKHPRVKLNEFQVRVIRKTDGLYQRELAEIFKVTRSAICHIRINNNWKHLK